MKLEPKAKPIKIRIKSGGDEHYSIESLKLNFNINDIYPLLDGRLQRWLRQQNQNEMADQLMHLNYNKDIFLWNIYNIFFQDIIKKKNIRDLIDLLELWSYTSVYEKNKNYLFDLLVNDISYAKLLYKCNDKKKWKLSNDFWIEQFSKLVKNNEKDAESLFILGKLLYESDVAEQKNDGCLYLIKSSKLGYKKSDSFIKENKIIYNDKTEKNAPMKNLTGTRATNKYSTNQSQKAFTTEEILKNKLSKDNYKGVDKEKIKQWINKKWKGCNSNISFLENDYSNEKEKILLNFICDCNIIGITAKKYNYQSALNKAVSFYSYTNKDDFLFKEKYFIIGLLYLWTTNIQKANEYFSKIKEYKLAEYMLSYNKFFCNINFKAMSLQNQISFFINNLFLYE